MEARSLLSSYLDGAVTGRQMQAVGNHLARCGGCRTEYVLLKQTQKVVAGLPRVQVPADLALSLRVALSREAAAARRPIWEGVAVRVENALNALMLPVTAGLVSALLLFGLLIGLFAMPAPVQGASTGDVPTSLYTPPVLASSPYSIVGQVNADTLLVEVYVGADGKVYDAKLLQPEDAQSIMPELRSQLILTRFVPAMSFGRPTAATTVLSFSKINVKG
jgi:hypothetical protein